MKDNIDTLIQQQQPCASICHVDEQGMSCCFNCFYVFNAEINLFYYRSHAETRHVGILLNNPVTAGTILPDKLHKLETKGIQFTGQLLPLGMTGRKMLRCSTIKDPRVHWPYRAKYGHCC